VRIDSSASDWEPSSHLGANLPNSDAAHTLRFFIQRIVLAG
jgi:hypothetical protein